MPLRGGTAGDASLGSREEIASDSPCWTFCVKRESGSCIVDEADGSLLVSFGMRGDLLGAIRNDSLGNTERPDEVEEEIRRCTQPV